MQELIEFIQKFKEGLTEQEICKHFKNIEKKELAIMLNELLHSNQIEITKIDNHLRYKYIEDNIVSNEDAILKLLKESGPKGMWLRDIKLKTNLPHNLLLKLLRNLEAFRKIKSINSVKNNKKIYMLFDVTPSDDVSGGIWFNNNDVDLIFVNKLMNIIYQYCDIKEEDYILPTINSLPRVQDVMQFLETSGISEVKLTIEDVNMLIDCLVYDGKIQKYHLENGIAIKCLRHNFYSR